MPLPTLKPPTLALTIHLLTELPASLSFLLTPTAQLPHASPEAKLILRNLGGLLMATNLLCLAVLLGQPQPQRDTTGPTGGGDDGSYQRLVAMLCLCLGTYHVWPIYRAQERIRMGGVKGGEKKVLGGPGVHLVVHVVCLVALVGGGGLALLDG